MRASMTEENVRLGTSVQDDETKKSLLSALDIAAESIALAKALVTEWRFVLVLM